MKPTAVPWLLLALAGCASTPPSAAPPATTPTQAVRTAPLNGDAIRSAIAPTSDADRDLAKWARSQGYFFSKIENRVYWCKREPDLGSHLARNKCVTDDQLAEMRRINMANKQDLTNAGLSCTSGGAGCATK